MQVYKLLAILYTASTLHLLLKANFRGSVLIVGVGMGNSSGQWDVIIKEFYIADSISYDYLTTSNIDKQKKGKFKQRLQSVNKHLQKLIQNDVPS